MIGKYFYLVSMISCAIFVNYAVELHLRVTDLEGRDIATIKQGESFFIEAIVLGEDNLGEPVLTPMKELASLQRYPVATHITITNGQQVTQRRYLYKAHIDVCGQFAIGPAYFDLGTHVIRSEVRSCKVEKGSGVATPCTTDPFIFVKVDHTAAYVNEPVVLQVRLCYKKPVDTLTLDQFSLTHALISSLGKPRQEPFTYDGNSWSSFVYLFVVYPQQAGELVIPELQARGTREKTATAGSFFAHFFSGFEREQIQARSQPVIITIKSLPSEARAMPLVGEVMSFTATLDKKTIDLSTAATLTIHVVGTINMAHVTFDHLAVPDGLKRYDAKRLITADEKQPGMLNLRHEIVLQSLKVGTFTIEPLTLSFFNAKTGRIDHATTARLLLNVQEHALPIPLEIRHAQELRRAWPRVPLWIMVALSTLLFGLIIIRFFALRYRSYIKKKIIFYKFRHIIKRVRTNKDAKLLHSAWFDFLAQHLGAERAPYSLYELASFFDEQLREKWRFYVAQLEQYAFKLQEIPISFDDIIEQTYSWIDELEGLL